MHGEIPASSEKSRRAYAATSAALVAAAEDLLDDKTIEAGRQSFKSKLEDCGLEYTADSLAAAKLGAEFMMVAQDQGQKAGKDINMPVLMTLAKLVQVERDIEKTAKAKVS